MQTFPFLFKLLLLYFSFCFTVQQIKQMYSKIRKKEVKKNVNPYKPSAFRWVIGTQ